MVWKKWNIVASLTFGVILFLSINISNYYLILILKTTHFKFAEVCEIQLYYIQNNDGVSYLLNTLYNKLQTYYSTNFYILISHAFFLLL